MSEKITVEISEDSYKALKEKCEDLDVDLHKLIRHEIERVPHRRIVPWSGVGKPKI